MTNQINKLSLSWGISKGRDTLGYNICRLDDRNNGRRFRTIGGGYDMVGTVFGEWLEANYQKELMEISQRAHNVFNQNKEWVTSSRDDRLYGMTYRVTDGKISLDGACGIDSMIRIAEAIGLEVERDYIAKVRRVYCDIYSNAGSCYCMINGCKVSVEGFNLISGATK